MNQRDEVVKYLQLVDFNSMCARDLLNGFYEQLKEESQAQSGKE